MLGFSCDLSRGVQGRLIYLPLLRMLVRPDVASGLQSDEEALHLVVVPGVQKQMCAAARVSFGLRHQCSNLCRRDGMHVLVLWWGEQTRNCRQFHRALVPRSCRSEAIEPEARDVVAGGSGGDEIGNDFPDHRRELEAVTGAR